MPWEGEELGPPSVGVARRKDRWEHRGLGPVAPQPEEHKLKVPGLEERMATQLPVAEEQPGPESAIAG